MRLHLLTGAAILLSSLCLEGADGPKAAPPLDPQVAKILSASTQYYAGLKTFEADVSSDTHMEMPTMKNDMASSFHIALERPNSFALTLKTGMMGGSILSDGKTWITYQPMMNKYTSVAAPALPDLLNPMNLALVEGGLPLGIEAFLSKDPMKTLTEGVLKSEYVGLEKIGGVPAHHLRLTSKNLVYDLWIAEGDKPLLLQTVMVPDLKDSLKGLPAAQKSKMPAGYDSMTMRRTALFGPWQVNEPVAAAAFQFQPPLGAQLVDEFFTPPPHPLIGKMAPDFQLHDLDGHPVKLADLRGKIVVLDFWATWCGPCVASLPDVAQVTSSFKDQGVVFYAANLKETADQIRQFQKDKNLTFPVLLDTEGKVSTLYLANAIPESVLIDREGKIQAVHVGYDANIRKKLTKQLTDLVAGKPLASATAVAAGPK